LKKGKPTNAELDFALMMMQFATMLLTLPPSPHITASIAQIFYVVSLLHQERRSRQDVGYLGRPVLSDPHESAAMRIVRHGDDRAFKKFVALSRGLFELVLGDIGPLRCAGEDQVRVDARAPSTLQWSLNLNLKAKKVQAENLQYLRRKNNATSFGLTTIDN